MENDELKTRSPRTWRFECVGMRPVIVHGGGPVIDAAVKQAGITPQFVRGSGDGPATMEIVRAGAGREDHKEIVSLLTARGGRPSASPARTASLIVARKRRSGPQPGRVGDVVGVNPRIIESESADFIPVVHDRGPTPRGRPTTSMPTWWPRDRRGACAPRS